MSVRCRKALCNCVESKQPQARDPTGLCSTTWDAAAQKGGDLPEALLPLTPSTGTCGNMWNRVGGASRDNRASTESGQWVRASGDSCAREPWELMQHHPECAAEGQQGRPVPPPPFTAHWTSEKAWAELANASSPSTTEPHQRGRAHGL